MGKRRKARECCLQILYQLEFEPSSEEKVLQDFWKNISPSTEIQNYCTWLVKGISEQKDKLDRILQSVSKNWKLERMTLIDRNILRIAVFELVFEKHITPAIIINEAIEIAKKFSGEKSAVFINGVLDAIRKSLPRMKNLNKAEENEGNKKSQGKTEKRES
ncbi:MAG: transcription antitermination factor NusB [Acidobacteriota bacterium]